MKSGDLKMAASKKSVIETLAKVKNLGPSYAEKAFDELGVQSLDDLIAAAQAGKLTTIKGVGANKEKAILESALELKGAAEKAAELVEPKPAPKTKATKAAPAPKAKSAEKAAPAPKAKAAKAPKAAPVAKAPKAPKAKSAEKAAPAPKAKTAKAAPAPKAPKAPKAAKAPAKAKTEPAKKPAAAKSEAPKPEPKKEAPKTEAPKAAPKAEAPKAERSNAKSSYTPPPKKSTHPVVFLGKLVFKIARKLLS